MAALAILGLAIGLQVITAVVVRRLIQVTGRVWIWVSLAAVVVLLTGWRCAMVLKGAFAGAAMQPDLATEGLVLLISLCMVSGLAGIASLMLSIQRAQEVAQQTAEAALRAQQQEYETIFHAVPSEIRFKDTDNRLVRVNRAAAEADGSTVADLEGKSLWQHYPAEIAAQEYTDDLEVIRTGQPKRGILTLYPTVTETASSPASSSVRSISPSASRPRKPSPCASSRCKPYTPLPRKLPGNWTSPPCPT